MKEKNEKLLQEKENLKIRKKQANYKLTEDDCLIMLSDSYEELSQLRWKKEMKNRISENTITKRDIILLSDMLFSGNSVNPENFTLDEKGGPLSTEDRNKLVADILLPVATGKPWHEVKREVLKPENHQQKNIKL